MTEPIDPLVDALQRLRAEDVAGATALLASILENEPRNAPALTLMGICLLKADDADGAIDVLKQAMDVAPSDTVVRTNFAVALRTRGEHRLENGRAEIARGDFLAALDVAPDDGRALFGLAQAEQELGHYEDAVEVYDAYLGADPDSADAYLYRGYCLQELRRLDDALDAYRRAVALDRSLYADVLKSLTTSSHGCLWLKPSDLKREFGLTS